jgi:hypothetical protein
VIMYLWCLGANGNLHPARTLYAVQHQIRKLQKLAANVNPCNGKGAAASAKKPASIKHKKMIAKQDERGASDENSQESPMKKRKLNAKEDKDGGGIEKA